MAFEMTITLAAVCPDSIDEHVRKKGYPKESVSKIVVNGNDVTLTVELADTTELRLELAAMLNEHDGILCQKKMYVANKSLERMKQTKQLRDVLENKEVYDYLKALGEMRSMDFSLHTLNDLQTAYPIHDSPWPTPPQSVLDGGVLV